MSVKANAKKLEVFSPSPSELEDWMAMFRIYADDSGKFETLNCDYTSLCGYVAHASEWDRFQLEWDNCRFRWGVPPIHMRRIKYPDEDSEWRKIKDDWGTQWEVKRRDMLVEFATIVERANLACVGAVVDAAYYRSLPESKFKKLYPDSLSLAFHQLVMRGLEKTEVIDTTSSVGLVIDDDRDSSMRCHQLLTKLKSAFPKVRERISGICFVNDKTYPGVQAADMVAYESRQIMVNKITNPFDEGSELYVKLTFLLTPSAQVLFTKDTRRTASFHNW